MVDAQGEPACVVEAPNAGLDDACETPSDCPDESGCVAVDGRAVCRPFCDPLEPGGVATCREFQEDARCVGAIGGHPEIGVCVRPCAEPGDVATSCKPAGAASACWIPTGLDFAVCSGTAGEAPVDAACGPDRRCATDLLCTPLGESGVCREVAPCTTGSFELPFPGAPRHRVCAACRPVAGPLAGDADDVRYLVCAADEEAGAAANRCVALGGALFNAARGEAPELAASAATVVDGAVVLAGACFTDGERTPCATGHALCRVATAR